MSSHQALNLKITLNCYFCWEKPKCSVFGISYPTPPPPPKERRSATVNKIYAPSEPGRCCLWCCWPETTPSRTGCWACPGGRRCWPSAPRTWSGGCCTSVWSARPWPRPPPAPPSEGPPGVSSRSNLKRTTDKQPRHGSQVWRIPRDIIS